MIVIHREIDPETATLAEAMELFNYVEGELRHLTASVRRQAATRAVKADGMTTSQVAREMGVSKTRVWQLLHDDDVQDDGLHEDEDQRELELAGAAVS